MCDTDRGRSRVCGLGRQVLVEERRELGAELLDVGIKSQLHLNPYSSAITARCSAAPPSSSSPALARFSAN